MLGLGIRMCHAGELLPTFDDHVAIRYVKFYQECPAIGVPGVPRDLLAGIENGSPIQQLF